MELKAKVSLEFIDYHIPKKLTFSQKVISSLSGPAADSFPNLPIEIQALQNTTDSLSEAEQAAMSGDRLAIQKRSVINAVWNNQFRTTAQYVSLVADGNVEQIKSTGFLPTKTTRQKKARIATLHNFQARVENAKGVASLSCKAAKGANGYVFVAAPETVKVTKSGDNVVLDINGVQVFLKTGTLSSAQFTNLPSAQRVNLSTFAFNASGSSELTDAQSVLVQ